MAYHVKEQAMANGLTGFYVYNDEKDVAGPWIEGWEAEHYIENLNEGRYMAKADRTTVMHGRRSNGKLVLRDQNEHRPSDVGDIEDDLVRPASRRDVALRVFAATVAAGPSRTVRAQAPDHQVFHLPKQIREQR
ncbi:MULTISPECIES: hypothetical protein [unclassified Mesorhizobium]|uniref:hypothetical protein n=1 Tax=unclassified Mesorhizobium TaxID=325217 RepID=UPI000BAF92DC|nr:MULTISPECIES: hypothetical protein [unclassified Mesorhizobium]PBB27442.1 hypothetical protein CK232_04610 [Mesorhizobium sp. WSM4304]PBB77044.1 hypothetical protein CK227_00305 [Mesorhizobium sp. WSM4308]